MEESIQQVPKRFNVRVYGLMINNAQEVLIAREIRAGMKMTKFPGGGLEFGEGIKNGLKREFQEELGIDIEVGELFYINDFLQVSAFNPQDQLLSIYYLVHSGKSAKLNAKEGVRIQSKEENLTFEWVAIRRIEEIKLSFPVDKVVSRQLTLRVLDKLQ